VTGVQTCALPIFGHVRPDLGPVELRVEHTAPLAPRARHDEDVGPLRDVLRHGRRALARLVVGVRVHGHEPQAFSHWAHLSFSLVPWNPTILADASDRKDRRDRDTSHNGPAVTDVPAWSVWPAPESPALPAVAAGGADHRDRGRRARRVAAPVPAVRRSDVQADR